MSPIDDGKDIHPDVKKLPRLVRERLSTISLENLYWTVCMECGESFKTSGNTVCEMCLDKILKEKERARQEAPPGRYRYHREESP